MASTTLTRTDEERMFRLRRPHINYILRKVESELKTLFNARHKTEQNVQELLHLLK